MRHSGCNNSRPDASHIAVLLKALWALPLAASPNSGDIITNHACTFLAYLGPKDSEKTQESRLQPRVKLHQCRPMGTVTVCRAAKIARCRGGIITLLHGAIPLSFQLPRRHQ